MTKSGHKRFHTNPTIYNVTLCFKAFERGASPAKVQRSQSRANPKERTRQKSRWFQGIKEQNKNTRFEKHMFHKNMMFC